MSKDSFLFFFIVEIYVYTYIHTVFWRRVSAPWTGAPLPHTVQLFSNNGFATKRPSTFRTLAWTNGILESLKAWVPWMNMLPLPISNAYEGLDSACYMQRSRCQVCCQIRLDRNRPARQGAFRHISTFQVRMMRRRSMRQTGISLAPQLQYFAKIPHGVPSFTSWRVTQFKVIGAPLACPG